MLCSLFFFYQNQEMVISTPRFLVAINCCFHVLVIEDFQLSITYPLISNYF